MTESELHDELVDKLTVLANFGGTVPRKGLLALRDVIEHQHREIAALEMTLVTIYEVAKCALAAVIFGGITLWMN